MESAVDADASVGERAPGPETSASREPAILCFVRDVPNVITLMGLCCGILGIYFAILRNFPAAMIAILWAVLFDWYDGPVARRLSGRSEAMKLFGGKLDSLADIVSMGVFPAVVLLSYGNFGGWFLPGACWIVMAGAVRLAYFDVFGVDSDGSIAGLSLDITPLLIALLFLLEGVVGPEVFAAVLYGTIVLLGVLHVAPFRMRKMAGRWYYGITVYVVGLSIAHGWLLWTQ
jgi:archaetidylserine synthase